MILKVGIKRKKKRIRIENKNSSKSRKGRWSEWQTRNEKKSDETSRKKK